LSIPITLISVPLCLSSIGATAYGILLIFFLIQSQCHILLFGTEKNLVRSIIQNRIAGENLAASMLLVFFYGVCVAVVLATLAKTSNILIYFSISSANFYLLLAGIPVHLLWTVQRSILQANEKLSVLGMATLGYMSSVQYMPLIVILFNPNNANVTSFMFGVLFAKVVITFLLFIPFRHHLRKPTLQQVRYLVSLCNYGKWMGANQTIQIIFDGADRYLLGLFSTPFSVALYAIPLQVTQKLAAFPIAMAQIVFNKSVEPDKIRSDSYLRDLLVVIPIFTALFLGLYKPFFSVWLGEYFDEKVLTLCALLFIAMVFTSLNFITTSIIESSGRARQLTSYDLVAMMPMLLLMAALTLYFDALGTAVAVILKESVFFILRIVILKPPRCLIVDTILSIAFLIISVWIALAVSFSQSLLIVIATLWTICFFTLKKLY
jgi:O-antigen/teichoic acid export membrane protein